MGTSSPRHFSMGLDFGTNSVRALIVDVADGAEVATEVGDYRHGKAGVLLDPDDPQLARQSPQDYLRGLHAVVRRAVHKKLGMPAGIPVAVGAFDAHMGAVGAGIRPGRLVK